MTELNATSQQLKSIIERIERLNEEIDGLKADVKEIYAEAKGNGFDKKAIRKIVAARRKSQQERQELEALIDTYASAIGETSIV